MKVKQSWDISKPMSYEERAIEELLGRYESVVVARDRCVPLLSVVVQLLTLWRWGRVLYLCIGKDSIDVWTRDFQRQPNS